MEETNETWRAIKRLWPIILIATLLGALAAFFATPAQVAPIIRSYRATTTMLVSNPGGSVGTVSFNQVPLFATTGEVPVRVAKIVNWGGEPAALAAQMQASIDPNTGTFKVSTQQPDSARAVKLANTFADELVKYLAQKQDEVLGGRLSATLKRVNDLKKQASALDAQVQVNSSDEVLKAQRDAAVRQYGAAYEEYQGLSQSLTAGLGLTTLERAQPVEVASGGFKAPQSRAARVPLAALVGGVLGLGLVMLMERFDGRVRDRRRAEQLMGAPVIAELATLGRRQRGTKVCVTPDNQHAIAESFRTLRTAVAFLVEGERKPGDPKVTPVIVVSSPSPGDGKTTTAANLAAAFAETSERVVVVNADFRHPRIPKFFLDDSAPDPLAHLENFENVRPEHFLRRTANPAIRVVDLSKLHAPPGELTRATTRVVAGLRPWVDVIIVDTPPLAVTAEALEFMHLASLALVIGRVGRTRVRSAIRAGELMRFAGATILSVALTDTGTPARSRNQYYKYSYTGPQKPLDQLIPARSHVTMSNGPVHTTEAAMNGAYGGERQQVRTLPPDPPIAEPHSEPARVDAPMDSVAAESNGSARTAVAVDSFAHPVPAMASGSESGESGARAESEPLLAGSEVDITNSVTEHEPPHMSVPAVTPVDASAIASAVPPVDTASATESAVTEAAPVASGPGTSEVLDELARRFLSESSPSGTGGFGAPRP